MPSSKFSLIFAAAVLAGTLIAPAADAARQPTWMDYVHGGDVMLRKKDLGNAQRYYAAALAMLQRMPRRDPRAGFELYRGPLNSLLYGYVSTCPVPEVPEGQAPQFSDRDMAYLKQRIEVERQIATTYSALFGAKARAAATATAQLAKAEKLYEQAQSARSKSQAQAPAGSS